MKKLSFLLLAVIFLAGNAWSQTAPTFKYEIGGKIEKMTLTDPEQVARISVLPNMVKSKKKKWNSCL